MIVDSIKVKVNIVVFIKEKTNGIVNVPRSLHCIVTC